MALLKAAVRCAFPSRLVHWIALGLMGFGAVKNSSAQLSAAREYQVKAVFLFNFAQFVDWPPGAFAETQSPLVIGILGENPFEGFLDDAVRGEKAHGHDLTVQLFRRVEEITQCHILFISRSESARLDQILAKLRGRPVLVVSDMENFARRGGMIRLLTENNKIRLRVNVEAARAAQLTISSKLLRPAQIVGPDGN